MQVTALERLGRNPLLLLLLPLLKRWGRLRARTAPPACPADQRCHSSAGIWLASSAPNARTATVVWRQVPRKKSSRHRTRAALKQGTRCIRAVWPSSFNTYEAASSARPAGRGETGAASDGCALCETGAGRLMHIWMEQCAQSAPVSLCRHALAAITSQRDPMTVLPRASSRSACSLQALWERDMFECKREQA